MAKTRGLQILNLSHVVADGGVRYQPQLGCLQHLPNQTSFVCMSFKQTVKVKKMKMAKIEKLLDSLGFYKRSEKGEEVPEEFQNFPLKAPRDEL